jgi:hypothetical protein
MSDLEDFAAHCEEAMRAFPLYTLDDARNPVRATMEEYVAIKRDENRCRVGGDTIGDVWVSTAFLGVDMNHVRVIRPDLPVLCFETAVFRPGSTDIVARYATWADAEAGHAAAVEAVRKEIGA